MVAELRDALRRELLEVARRHPTFPIILETLRAVLQDAYDVPALLRLTLSALGPARKEPVGG